MLAVTAARIDPDDPLSGLEVGERSEPDVPEGWVEVEGPGRGSQPPRPVEPPWRRVAGRAAADDPRLRRRRGRSGRQRGRGPRRDRRPGRRGRRRDARPPAARCSPSATRGRWPSGWRCLDATWCRSRPRFTWEEAACLPPPGSPPTDALHQGGAGPGSPCCVQGAGGSAVSTALVVLARAAGLGCGPPAATRPERDRALGLGAHRVFPSGERLPEKVDSGDGERGQGNVGASVRSLRPRRNHRRGRSHHR